jgi:hypothetical protein
MALSKIFIKTNKQFSWSTANKIFVKTDTMGSWKTANRIWVKTNKQFAWELAYTSGPSIAQRVQIEQTTEFNTGLITLVGYNYYWTDYNSSTYTFEKSINGGNTWYEIQSGTILNPISGNSNQKQYAIDAITPNYENIYRFTVTTTSNTGESTLSTSTTTSVQAPRDITNLSYSTRNASSVSLTWTPSQYSSSQLVQYKIAGSNTYTCPPGYGTAYQDGGIWYCQRLTYPNVVIVATPPTSVGNWTGYNTYSGSTSSATISGLNSGKSYNFKIIPYTETSLKGYSGNDSNILTVTTETSQYYCNPKYNLNCGSLIYTSETKPTIVSAEGSPCYVSDPITQYKYYTNQAQYACDGEGVTVSRYDSPCPGCSVVGQDTSYWSCTGTSISTDSNGTGCHGCSVDTVTDYVCKSRLTSCTVQNYTCKPKVTTTCTNGPFTSTNSNAYPTNCSRTSNTTYTCKSGTSGGDGFCYVNVAGSLVNVGKATVTTTYTFYLYENTTTCNGSTIATDASGTGCLGCAVTTNTSIENCYKCDGAGYSVSGFDSSCPGCSITTNVTRTCRPVYISDTSLVCKSRLYYTCTQGPYWSDTNPASYSCGNIDLVTSYNYKKYVSEYTCNNTTSYFTSIANDPECKGCQINTL